jgi:Fe-S cluster biogenesis protein NfuA
MGLIERVKGMFSADAEVASAPTAATSTLAPPAGVPPEAPVTAQVGPEQDGEWLEVDITDPGPEAATCRLAFNRLVAPEGTALFETPQDAADWPAVRALLGIPGVHSVISKGMVLIVAKHERSAWPEILSQVEAAIRNAFDAGASEPTQVPLAAGGTDTLDLRGRIQRILTEEVNPAVAEHGGYIELLDVQDTRVFIHMGGGCQGCAMSAATLKNGVETTLRAQIPEITEILDTTDHASGANPFFQADAH